MSAITIVNIDQPHARNAVNSATAQRLHDEFIAFEADDTYKNQAMESFRKAKNLHKWNGGLPQRYFSKRIRKVFDSAS